MPWGGRRQHQLGPVPITDACHDITVYPEIELAAGACEGNGLLIDISDPANPKRIDAVADPLFAYWHGATFSNDGKTVVFTDEWGGGTAAALPCDRPAELGRERDLRHRRREAGVPQLLQVPPVQTVPGELRQPHPVAGPCPGSRHLRAGLVPGRRVDGRLQRLVATRSRSATTIAARSARALVLGGPVVDLLVQRRDLRLGDRPRPRRLRAHRDRPDVRERDRRGARGAGRPPERAAPGPAHLGAELRGGPVVPRPARAVRDSRARRSTRSTVHRPRRALRTARRPSAAKAQLRASPAAQPRTSSTTSRRGARPVELAQQATSLRRAWGGPGLASARPAPPY